MIFNLYVLFDRISGIYGSPVCQVNDAVAIRSVVAALDSQPGLKSDYELYKIGSFDSATGVVSLCDKEFVFRGEDK